MQNNGTIQKSAKTDRFQHHDYYGVDALLTEEHLLAREAVRAWVKQEVSPIIEEYAEKGKCPQHLFKGLAEIGAFGPSLPVEYGGGGMDEIAYGIIMQELERGDSGIRSMASVQGSLVMYPIYRFGSEEQRKKYLPKLGSGEFIGCFGLTEPDHGSNPAGMITNIKDDGDAYILNGAKIGKGSIIAAGAVVLGNTVIPERSLVVGTPGKVVKTLDESIIDAHIKWAKKYVMLSQEYINKYR